MTNPKTTNFFYWRLLMCLPAVFWNIGASQITQIFYIFMLTVFSKRTLWLIYAKKNFCIFNVLAVGCLAIFSSSALNFFIFLTLVYGSGIFFFFFIFIFIYLVFHYFSFFFFFFFIYYYYFFLYCWGVWKWPKVG